MGRLQHYGIKFPITIKSFEKTFFDLDIKKADGIRSELMHLIFTPKGQRIRNPLFGTNLIQFIFSPNDEQTWSDIKAEIKDSVAKFMPNTSLNDIEIYETDNGLGLIAVLQYTVTETNGETSTYQLATKL